MLETLIFCSGAAAGFAFAIYAWPSVRLAFVGAEQELTRLRSQISGLEARVRAALGRAKP